ncbi:30S ribosomal protein S3 [Candidatus Nomurabacteria bacterium]|nr:30S ribosomal protein S3 [Candidatus Nomurabacteria bacterium]
MSQVSHPYGYRLVTLRDWKSRWFSAKPQSYRELLRADVLLREYLEKRLHGFYVSNIEFERGRKSTRVLIHTSRPGMVIGRSGEGAQKLRADILKFMNKNNIAVPTDFKVDIVEVQEPEADAMIVAHMIDEALRRRMPFRRVIKQTIEKVMAVKGVLGCRIVVSGLVGGSATMSRKEQVKNGPIPLQFLRADIDYASLPVLGHGIGIKVWINKGDSLAKEDTK